jgi:hypothetical protein
MKRAPRDPINEGTTPLNPEFTVRGWEAKEQIESG